MGKSMKNLFLKTLAIGLFLLAMPLRQQAQQPFANNGSSINFDISEIAIFDERVIFLYNLFNDSRFDVTVSERDGIYTVSANPSFGDQDLKTSFADFKEQNALSFSKMDKETATATALQTKRPVVQ